MVVFSGDVGFPNFQTADDIWVISYSKDVFFGSFLHVVVILRVRRLNC